MTGGRWAVSPTDLDAHLLVAEQLVPGELRARCAAVLPPDAPQYDKPPDPRLCPSCWIVAQARGHLTQ